MQGIRGNLIMQGIYNSFKNYWFELSKPNNSYSKKILKFFKDNYHHLAINGLIYTTKQAVFYLFYLMSKDSIVDINIESLERVTIDGFYSFAKKAYQQVVVSIGAALSLGGIVAPQVAILYAVFTCLNIHQIKILDPSVEEVTPLSGHYVPTVETPKDAVVFDTKNEPLPPGIEKSVEHTHPSNIQTLDTEYEITEKKLVPKIRRLKNKFSNRFLKREKLRPAGKTVYFSDIVKQWSKEENDSNDIGISITNKIKNN